MTGNFRLMSKMTLLLNGRYLRGYYSRKEAMPDVVQGAEENVSHDFFDDVNQFEEQEREEEALADESEFIEEDGKLDEWEGVELARLATIREEEERWGFTQTRELEIELAPEAEDQRHSLDDEDELSRQFERLDLNSSRPLQQSDFHYVKGNDTLEFEKLERSLLRQDSTRKGNYGRGRFEKSIPEEDYYAGHYSGNVDNPFETSNQLLRTTEKPICVETVASEPDMKGSGDEHGNLIEDVEGVWHLDDDGAKVDSEELDLAAWIEAERRALEQLLGEEKLVRLYQVVAMMEGEEEELEAGWQEVDRVVGNRGEGLVDRVIQLVMADTHFMNSE